MEIKRVFNEVPAKGLNTHIITRMKGTSWLAQFSTIPMWVCHSSIILQNLFPWYHKVNFHMPEFHTSHTFEHYMLRSLNPAFLLPFQNFILQSPNICTTICHKVCLPKKYCHFCLYSKAALKYLCFIAVYFC